MEEAEAVEEVVKTITQIVRTGPDIAAGIHTSKQTAENHAAFAKLNVEAEYQQFKNRFAMMPAG